MARQFNGTDQWLQSASAIDLSAFTTLAISLWFWWDAFASDDDLLLELGTDAAGGFTLDPNSGSVFSLFTYDVGSTNLNAASIPRPSAGAWHHLVVNIDRAAASSTVNPFVSVFMDSVSQTVTDGQHADLVDAFGNAALFVNSRNGASLFGAGRTAELCLYGGSFLTQGNVDTLWNGGAGRDARAVSIPTHYWQLCGSASPEPALVGGIAMTVNGATPVTHPISGAGICAAVLMGGMSM